MEVLIPVAVVLVVSLVIAGAIYSYRQAKKRREDLARLAGSMGLRYDAADPYDIANRCGQLAPLAQGHNRSAYNVLHGQYGGFQVKAFDYVYHTTETSTDSEGRTTTREVAHYFSAVLFDVGTAMPSLLIRPESFFDKIAAALGFDDIDFESAEFSRKFFVKASDKKFAFDVIHPRMMEYLMENPAWTLQLEGAQFLVLTGGMLTPDELAAGMHHAEAFLKQIPKFVWDRLRGR
jgi:hypothetical protein